MHSSFRLNSPEFFRVRWDGDNYPKHKDGCGQGCIPSARETCLCDIIVSMGQEFTDPTKVPTVPELEASLFVGSVDPDTLDNELIEGPAYMKCTSTLCKTNTEVTVHLKQREVPHGSTSGSNDSNGE